MYHYISRYSEFGITFIRDGLSSYVRMYLNNLRQEKRGKKMPTPSMEDYLERIYKLIDEKGYARVSDIAEGLEVHPSSVTKMIQKLDKDEYLIYEKYRGLILTTKGKKIGKRLVDRHQLLEQFLTLIGVQHENIYNDVEGIEHHLSWDSITQIEMLVEYFRRDEQRIQQLRDVHKELVSDS